MSGAIEQIFIGPSAGQPLLAVARVRAEMDRGLEGDRYFAGNGTFSRWPGEGRAITFIEAEAVEAILAETGIDLSQCRHRRNIITRGIRLETLNGSRFRIGSALFRGSRVCAPCKYLEKITEPGVFAAMKGRGGLRAEIIESGEIAVGDAIVQQ